VDVDVDVASAARWMNNARDSRVRVRVLVGGITLLGLKIGLCLVTVMRASSGLRLVNWLEIRYDAIRGPRDERSSRNVVHVTGTAADDAGDDGFLVLIFGFYDYAKSQNGGLNII